MSESIADDSFSRTPALSAEHRKMLEAGSGISPEVIAARGYWTAERLSDVPDCFPAWQKRCGLVVPMYSPDGETVRYQLRPDKRRRKGPKYETPKGEGYIMDVHPFSTGGIKDPSVTLWITEGAKTGDALTSRGRCVAVLAGVWNFAVAGTHSRELLPCFDHVPLRGRRVIVAYDADARTNADVQDALGRLVAALEGRGARPLVVYVPTVNGDGKAGADDYLAAGGDLEALESSAVPYEPLDVARERVGRDGELAATVAACEEMLETMPAGYRYCSRRAVLRYLIAAGARKGKARADGLLVVRSCVDGAVGSRVSERAWWKAIEALEADGALKRARWGARGERAGAYLLTPWGGGSAERAHIGREAKGGDSQEVKGEMQRARSFPLSHAPYDQSVHEMRAPENLKKPERSGIVPVLRWPKVVHTWAWREGRRVVVDSDYVARIGKAGEEIARYLLEHGRTPEAELLAKFGSKTARLRDFKRRRIKPLVDRGILDASGEDLAPDWREALERARVEAGELKDNRLQAQKAERRKRERREHFAAVRRGTMPKAVPTPELPGKAATRELLERQRPSWRQAEADKRRRMVAPALAFVSETLGGLDHVRLGLLEEMWRERGGQTWHLRLALRELRCKAKRHSEHPGELFVYPPSEAQAPEPKPAPVTRLLRPDYGKPELRDGIHVHGPECSCRICDEPPPTPRYATAKGTA